MKPSGSKKNVAGPLYKIQLPRLEFRKMNEELNTLPSPKSNKSAFPKKLLSPTDTKLKISIDSTSLVKSMLDSKYTDQNSPTKDSKSPKSSKHVGNLFKTKTKFQEFETVTVNTVDNQHDSALKTGAGNALQPTKKLKFYDCFEDSYSPEEWVELCQKSDTRTHGKVPIYQNQKYYWVDVRVISYDQEKKKFLVQMIENGILKYVGRLSLIFNKEDPIKFRQRIEEAKQRQYTAEDEMRFYTYVDNLPVDIGNLDPEVKKRILSKIARKKKKDQEDYKQTSINNLLETVEHLYKLHLKKYIVICDMKDPETQKFYDDKRIKIRETDEEVPYFNLYEKIDINIANIFQKIKAQHVSSKKAWIDAMKMMGKKSSQFTDFSAFATNIQEKELPMDLDDFMARQKSAYNSSVKTVHSMWRDYLIGEVQDILKHEYNFYSVAKEDYFEQEFQRFITRVDLYFNTNVREQIVASSLIQWVKFLRRNILSDPKKDSNVWQLSEKPLLILNIQLEEKSLKKKVTIEKKKEKKDKQKDEDSDEENELIYFSPSIETITEQLLEPVRLLIELSNSIFKLEADLVPFLYIPKTTSYKINPEEEFITDAINKIKSYIEIGLKEPIDIINKFKKYEFLFQKKIRQTIKEIRIDSSTEKIREELDRLSRSMREIIFVCPNEKNSLFFQIRTKVVKENLLSKTKQLKESILERVSGICKERIEKIMESYMDMEQRLLGEPKNEKELMILKDEINNHAKKIAEHELEIKKVSEYLDILDDNVYPFNKEDWRKYWDLKEWPNNIKACVFDASRRADQQENKFKQKLDDEKVHFVETLESLQKDFNRVTGYNQFNEKTISIYYNDVQGVQENFHNAQETVKSFNDRENMFKIPMSDYDTLNALQEAFEPFVRLWRMADDISTKLHEWRQGRFSDLRYDPVEKFVDNQVKEIGALTRIFNDKSPEAITVLQQVKKHLDTFKIIMPLIEMLTNEAMRKKPGTWADVFKACGMDGQYKELNDNITLDLLDKAEMLKYREKIDEIVRKTEKQWKIEKKLTEMSDKVKNIELELIFHDKSGCYLVKTVDEIQQLMDEYLNTVQSLKNSPFIKGMKIADQIEKRFLLIQDTLDNWMKVQRGWLYLEPIFSSDDINKKLPKEHRLFSDIDRKFRDLMEKVSQERKVFDKDGEIDLDRVNTDFQGANKELDKIQKALSDYLEVKRRDFPRFFFLSDEELLEILSETKDPTKVQPHMSKCFEAINEVEFGPNQEVMAMISSEKEKVKFIKPVDVNEGDRKGNVEKWLSDVEVVMQKTLQHITKQCIHDTTQRVDWVRKWPGQIILAVNQVKWTQGAETAILRTEEYDIEGYENHLKTELNDIIDLVRGNLTSLERLTLGALVVIDVHARDVIHELVVKAVDTITDFEWLSQLRYYWDEQTHIKVRMINAEMKYNFEYLGNSTRLVITPLTDRCYRTLLGAFALQYGGAPEGPAGTGKTESVKDLAKAIAIMCVVFNCSDTLNYLAMRKFFKGLVASGGWCCFDEFNRINQEVLSVIAQQVMQIQEAIRKRVKSFPFDGEDNIKLVLTCAINITMNPGYAGRSELPDNLKARFRPCAMMVPDYSMISEIILYSYGFKDARNLARKIVASLKLSSEQLSTQQHYDFGMRALKAILTAAGQLKRTMKEVEDIVCMRALYDVNLPKFTMNDIPLFLGITQDLFPGVTMNPPDYNLLTDALKQVLEENKLIPEPSFIKKCIQLYETIMVRHGLMMVGATFSGKSRVVSTLERAMTILKEKEGFTGALTLKLNPKSIRIEQLYGKFDPDSKAWTDGVLCILMRNCVREIDNPQRKWLMFDGPVDAVWIENMNTVLDDNKKLCLTSGEIIKMSPQMTMMFEVEDLQHASPATVSRCGMVYLEPKNLGWEALLKSFIKRLPEIFDKAKDHAQDIIKWFLDASTAFAKKFGKFPMKISEMNLAYAAITLIDILFTEYLKQNNITDKLPTNFDDIVDNITLFACIWGIGGAFEEEIRPNFHTYMLKLLACNDVVELYGVETLQTPFEPRALKMKLNDPENLFDITYDIKKGVWVSWMQTVPKFVLPKETPFHEIIVPTVESLRAAYLMKLVISNKRHILFTGPTGTGKTVTILYELNNNYGNEDYTNLSTCLSGQTQANLLQFTIEARMTTKRRKGVYGPEDRKKNLVIFIDDLNMPAKDEYGAQPPIELLRQWMDYKGWYDLDTKEFKTLEDMLFIGAMSPPSAGRNTITNRYSRHFIIQYMEPFSSFSLKSIYSSVLDWYYAGLKDAPKGLVSLKDNIINSTIELYNKIKVSKELLPTPAKSHYIYNLRDISKVFQGISKASHQSFPESPDADFIKLWIHECLRVFQDRLINNEDRNYMHQMIKDILRANFRKEWNNIVQVEPLLWANFVPTIYPDGDKSKKKLTGVYCELTDREEMRKASEAALEEYNQFNSSANRMNLVLFQTAIEHVIKIVRIISTSFGHALLVGVGGSGRRSLATLACSIVNYDICTIEVGKNYDQKAWNEDLQRILKKCGLDLKPTIFIFTDAQVWKESILEDISSLLNNGEVPNLFPVDEKAKILDNMTENGNETPNEKFQRFITKCKEFLHLVLCLSPVGEAFRRRMRTFPSLVNCTTIDWFLPWPEEALRSVAVAVLKDIQLDKHNKDGVIDIFVDMQQRVTQLTVRYYQELRKYYYVTPTSYLELLATFMRILEERKKKVDEMKRRYSVGLEALYNAEKDVVKMKAELDVLTPQLKVKKEEASHMLIKINEEKKIVDAERLICEAEEKQCNIQKEEAERMRESCEEKLKKVYPILEKAKQALNNIDKNELNQVKTYNTVTNPVRVTMQAVCVLKDIKPIMKKEGMENIEDWWGTAKKKLLVSVDAFMKDIKSYDVKAISNVDAKIIAKLKKDFLTNPDFDEKAVLNASVSAANIAEWIRAVVSVYDAYLVVEPEQRALDLAENALKKAEQILADKKAKLQEVLNRLKLLEDEFEQTKIAKETLEARVEKCNTQIKSAEKLTVGLASEKVLWKKRAEDLEESGRSVLGDSVLSSGFVAYLGAFPLQYREECVQVWGELLDKNNIVKTPNFKLEDVLSDAIQVGNWCNKYKLPNDSISVENAIIMTNSKRWSLMIDPQVQAHKWICEMEKIEKSAHNPKATTKLFIIKPTWTPKEYMNKVEICLSYGYPVLLENIGESIDPVFDSILSQKVIKRGTDLKIKFGEGEVDYSEEFKLYITTKLSRPHYPPEVCVKVTLLNFTVTPEGLEDNMLNIVVKEEETLIEEKRQNNILETFRNKEKQRNTEDLILSSLANATGNILDNTVLIDTLSNSKIEAQEIENKIEELKKDSVKFQQVRVQYKKVAKRVSSLFFVIADLSTIEPVYQYSLEWYVGLYYDAIKTSVPTKDSKDQRCHNIIERFMLILYDNVCRSLLEKDKLLFIFLIVVKIMMGDNRVIPAEVRFLLVGGTSLEISKPNPGEGWLSVKQWATIEEVVKTHPQSFANFDTEFIENIDGWKQIVDANEPTKMQWPKKWSEKLNSIQKLIILRILRPDKVITAIQELVVQEMGDSHFIEGGGALDLQAVYKDSERNIINPIIFILSPGVDPLSEIFRLAEKQGGGRGNVVPLSLGQGMAATAVLNILDGVKNGRWIVLENCHLAPSFMPELEKTIESIADPTSSYRLWLTTMPSDTFPVSILQNGIKLTNEPPKGIRNNLMRTYKAMDIKLFDAEMKEYPKPAQYKKLLFALSFFHAHVQERKKFGPLGWNIPYEFNSADLTISRDQLKIFLKDYDEIPWEALNYMVAEANYGGRVTDPMDRRLIKSILKDFYTVKILDDKYRFSPNPLYFAPPEGNLMDYIDYIKDLPFNETADLFGLHQNAEISSAIAETNQLLGNALSLQPRTSSGTGLSSEQIIKEKCASILSKLPAPFVIEDVAKKHPVRYEESMNTVLQQELLRYNNLLLVVTSSLKQLSKAIEGLVVMSPELEEVFNKMFDNLVPGLWQKAAYPSRKPLGSWVIDLGQRLKFMQKWIDEGAPPSFWISGFYFTQSFLTGTLQNYARKTKIPIDTLSFDFYVIKSKDDPKCDIKKSPADGCYVYGLFLDGCRWDEEQMTLEESHPKILNYVMPYIWLIPKKQDDIDKTKHIYECPVYKTSRRAGTLSTTGHSTNFVLNMLLPMTKRHDQNHWIKRGIALLTQLDD